MTQGVNSRAEMQTALFPVLRSQTPAGSGSSNFESYLGKADAKASKVSAAGQRNLNTEKAKPESLQSGQKPKEAQEAGETAVQKQTADEDDRTVTDGEPGGKIDGKPDGKPRGLEKADAAEEPASADGETDAAAGIEEMMETLAAALMGFLTELAEDVLSVTAEDVQKWMISNEMSLADMLNPENLQQLVMDLNGLSDVSGFLTDGAALGEWNEIQNMLTDFVQEHETLLTETAAAEPAPGLQEQVQQLTEMNQTTETDQLAEMEQLTEKPEPEQKADTDAIRPDGQEETAESASRAAVGQMADGQTSEEASSFQTEGQKSGGAVPGSRASTAEKMDEQMPVTFLNRLNEAVGQAAEILEAGAEVRQTADILNQVVSQIRVGISQEITSMDFMLHPENLGRVNVSVTARGGVMTAQITVSNQEAKEALESQMIILKQTFEEQGLKVDSVEVNVSEFAFGDESQAGNSHTEGGDSGRRNGRSFRFDDTSGAEDPDSGQGDLPEQMLNMTGTQVDYSA